MISGGGGVEHLPNTGNVPFSGKFRLYDPLSTAYHKQVRGQAYYISSVTTGIIALAELGGSYRNTAAVDGFQLLMSSGNIASGVARLYGVAK